MNTANHWQQAFIFKMTRTGDREWLENAARPIQLKGEGKGPFCSELGNSDNCRDIRARFHG